MLGEGSSCDRVGGRERPYEKPLRGQGFLRGLSKIRTFSGRSRGPQWAWREPLFRSGEGMDAPVRGVAAGKAATAVVGMGLGVGPARFELATSSLSGMRSNQLSYGPGARECIKPPPDGSP